MDNCSKVRDAELRLTEAEVAAIMTEFGIELNETEVELLTARTEGWIAGVQMAAVSLRDESLPDLFLTEFAKTASLHHRLPRNRGPRTPTR